VTEHSVDIAGEELAPTLRPLAHQLLDLVSRLPECADFSPFLELSIVLTDDPQIQDLNLRWRSLDKPTDVLSFPLEEGACLGDVVISVETARRRVDAPHWLLEDELLFLLVHGVLHLLGYDHMEDADRTRMETTEQALWTALGRSGTLRAQEATEPS